MATRATYTFKSEGGIEAHIYIHYDGYPRGAASYFKKMMELLEERQKPLSDLRGGLVEQFIRANKNAEFTEHWQIHGDTEWHYEIDGDQLTVLELEGSKDLDDSEDRKGRQFFKGSMGDYLKEFYAN